jgi:hypothetical protein
MSEAGVNITAHQDRGAELETAGPDDARQEGYVLWTYIGPESVYFYPPGSPKEHLVTEHGIPSIDMHWEINGRSDHQADHLKQTGARAGGVGDLLAVAHPYPEAA